MKLALFDIDGTLIHTGGAGVRAFARAFADEFGVGNASDRVNFAGRTDTSLVREVFVRHGIEPSTSNFDRFFDRYLSQLPHFLACCDGQVCPGVLELLEAFRRLPEPPHIGLLTGNIRRGAEIKLSHFNLWQEFAFGGFADDHEQRDGIAVAARKRGTEHAQRQIEDDEILVIGDTPHDIRCGRAIKARVLAVATGGATVEQLKQHQPDWVVGDLREISAQQLCQTTSKAR